jgi:hypothetical protein
MLSESRKAKLIDRFDFTKLPVIHHLSRDDLLEEVKTKILVRDIVEFVILIIMEKLGLVITELEPDRLQLFVQPSIGVSTYCLDDKKLLVIQYPVDKLRG